jgi:Na+/H+ antiporter NhaD/arsenite permease-like protein
MKTRVLLPVIALILLLVPMMSFGATDPRANILDPSEHPLALVGFLVFVVAYVFVIAEEAIHMRKSKAVTLAAGIIWVLIGIGAMRYGISHEELHEAVMHDLDEYGALLLFLLVAMTYISAMQERNVFAALRSWLLRRGWSYKKLFWATGIAAFFLSPIADNLTTALIMGAVIVAIGAGQPRFVTMSLVSVVVAANAGGAFSPFGDITTLMVWQAGHVDFFEFFRLFLPSVTNYVVPAAIMSLFLPKGAPEAMIEEVSIKRGGKRMIVFFLITISLAVTFENVLGLPPFLGMMTGLSFLMLLSYYLRRTGKHPDDRDFDIFVMVSRAEWDTLLFFFGVIFAVGGLAYVGYVNAAFNVIYTDWGPTGTHIFAGIASAVVDNIPVMFAILSTDPPVDHFQWLLVTLTAGVGGSLLSIGSAAGVALMGQSKGAYTFFGHLKWSWVIFLGYAASIGVHFLVNGSLME